MGLINLIFCIFKFLSLYTKLALWTFWILLYLFLAYYYLCLSFCNSISWCSLNLNSGLLLKMLILLRTILASSYLCLLTRNLGVSSRQKSSTNASIIIGNPITTANMTLQLLTYTKRIGKMICPMAQPTINVTKDNFLNLSAPISETYSMLVISNPFKLNPKKNKSIIRHWKLGVIPQRIFKPPPISSDVFSIDFLP